jgi:hypothetical protein
MHDKSQSGTVFLNSEEGILSIRNGGSWAISSRVYFGGGILGIAVVGWLYIHYNWKKDSIFYEERKNDARGRSHQFLRGTEK